MYNFPIYRCELEEAMSILPFLPSSRSSRKLGVFVYTDYRQVLVTPNKKHMCFSLDLLQTSARGGELCYG